MNKGTLVRFVSSSLVRRYAALDNLKVRVRVVSNKKKNGKPSKGPGSHMTYKEMTTKLGLNKDAPSLDLPLLPQAPVPATLYAYGNLRELHHLGSFNRFQFNELWKAPFSVSRQLTTGPLVELVQKAQAANSLANRLILLGEAGVGKTTLVSQFHSLAKLSKSVVIHFNDCEKLINGSNDYIFDSESSLYHQPMYLNKLFNKIKKGNLQELSDLKLSKGYKFFQFSLSTKNNLVDLINVGKKLKNGQKFAVWNLLIDELNVQSTYPVHLTVDNFSAIIKRPYTNYRDSQAQFIYFDQFTLAKFLIDHISGKSHFNKGSVLIATKGGRQRQTLTVPLGLAEFDPYAKVTQFDSKLASYLQGLKYLEIPKFNKEELKVLLDQCLKSDLLKNDALEDETKLLNGKYILSGNGNPYEFYKACVVNYF